MTIRDVVSARFPDVELDDDGVFGCGEIDANELEYDSGFLLIEHGQCDELWLSWHASADDASEYHVNQEGAEWWADATLLDLATGAEYVTEVKTSWIPKP